MYKRILCTLFSISDKFFLIPYFLLLTEKNINLIINCNPIVSSFKHVGKCFVPFSRLGTGDETQGLVLV